MIKLFVPGRLCLFGEHTDWAGHYRTMNAEIYPGAAIVTGIEQGIYAEIERSPVFEVTSSAPEIEGLWNNFSCRMNDVELKKTAKSDSFFCYCAGVASYMLEWYKVGGVKINITSMTLPIKSGLSSSAAICVLVARAFNKLYHLNLNTLGEMNIAYLGELRTASRCGRLDQACAFGVKPSLMLFDGDEVEVRPMTVKKALYWVIADLCSHKDTVQILADLNKCYPFAMDEDSRKLHDFFGAKNREIVERATKYIATGDAENLGRLMTETEEMFDSIVTPMSPALASPKLHKYLSDEKIKPLVYGGKGVGSHGDGSVQFLARDVDCQTRLKEYLNDCGLKAYSFTLQPVHTVKKAVIPVAGFGTRLFPATCAIRKDFFPIPCSDGMVRPVILLLLEELMASGIEEVCIVLGSEEERSRYADFFETPLPDDHLKKLSPQQRGYANHILDIGKHLHYVYQTEKRGFGHAVFQASEFAGNEPVLLLLGDTLYRSDKTKTCALQLIEEYEKYNKPVVAIHSIDLEDVSKYGILSGKWDDEQRCVLNVSRMAEKPDKALAETELYVSTPEGKKEYWSVFGQYILTHDVFDRLAADIMAADAADDGREIELTAALDAVRKQAGMLGVRIQGRMFDMGNHAAFRTAVMEYGNS